MNLGAFGSGMAFGWQDAERRRLGIAAAEMGLREKQSDLDADHAIFKVLSDPDTAAVPYATPMPANTSAGNQLHSAPVSRSTRTGSVRNSSRCGLIATRSR